MPKMPLVKWIDIPPVWLVGFIGLAVVMNRLLPGLALRLPFLGLLGWALIALGFVLTVLALRAFRISQTTPVPHQVPKTLITDGIFRFSRNPIYLGDACFLAALCLFQGAWSLPLLVPLFIWVITARFIQPEEARLEKKFGAAFTNWAQATRRWL